MPFSKLRNHQVETARKAARRVGQLVQHQCRVELGCDTAADGWADERKDGT